MYISCVICGDVCLNDGIPHTNPYFLPHMSLNILLDNRTLLNAAPHVHVDMRVYIYIHIGESVM